MPEPKHETSPDYESVYTKLKAEPLKPEELSTAHYVSPVLKTLNALEVALPDSLMSLEQEYCQDGGLSMTREFISPEGERIAVPGPGNFNRNAFIDYFSRRLDNGSTFAFREMDLKRLRSADNAIDNEGNSAADILLNNVGTVLKNEVPYLRRLVKSIDPTADILECRYGGDEFYIGYENVPEDLRNFVYKKLAERVRSIQGYYLDDLGNQVLETADIKEASDEITVPTDPHKSFIFKKYFSSMILSTAQVDLIYDALGKDLVADEIADIKAMAEFQHSVSEDINFYTNTFRKLAATYPELASSFESILTLDLPDTERVVLYKQFQEFFDNNMCDKLIGRRVAAIHEFAKVFKETPFSGLFVFDFPIKEPNTDLSYAHGDEGILTIWREIQHVCLLHDYDPSNFMFARRGASIFVGIRNEIPEELQNDLLSLHALTISLGTKSYKYNFASSYVAVDAQQQFTNKEVGEVIQKGSYLARSNWYKARFTENWKEPALFMELPEDVVVQKNVSPDWPDIYYRKYFFGNTARRRERISFAVVQLDFLIANPPADILEEDKPQFIENMQKVRDNFTTYLE